METHVSVDFDLMLLPQPHLIGIVAERRCLVNIPRRLRGFAKYLTMRVRAWSIVFIFALITCCTKRHQVRNKEAFLFTVEGKV